MPELWIANKIEVLVEIFHRDYALARKHLNPLSPIDVITPSARCASWLNNLIARRCGVAGNISFSRPQAYLERYLMTYPDTSVRVRPSTSKDPSARWQLFWTIFHYLGVSVVNKDSLPIEEYLKRPDHKGMRRMKLTQKLTYFYANLIWQDPDLLMAWERGERCEQQWEAKLWQGMLRHCNFSDAEHFVLRYRQCLDPDFEPNRLETPLYVFLHQSIPPIFFKWLQCVALKRPVTIFAMMPVFPEEAITKSSSLSSSKFLKHYELLWMQLMELSVQPNVLQLDTAMKRSTLLTQLQMNCSRGILHWLGSEVMHALFPQQALSEDNSFRLHRSSSPLREVEALHNDLVARLQADPTLQFNEILVVVPNLIQYAPLLRSVFGKSRSHVYLPVSLESYSSAQSLQSQQLAFLFLLECGILHEVLPQSILEKLLVVPCVLQQFGLHTKDLEQMRLWWSFCDAQRGLEAKHLSVENTTLTPSLVGLRSVLQQLLVAYAVGPGNESKKGVFPPRHWIPSLETADIIGKALNLVNKLCTLRVTFDTPATGSQWVQRLRSLLENWFGHGEETRLMRASLEEALFPALLTSNVSANEPITLSCGAVLCLAQNHFAQIGQKVLAAESGNHIQISEPEKANLVPYRMIAILGLGIDAYAHTRLAFFDQGADFTQGAGYAHCSGPGVTWVDFLAASKECFYLSYLHSIHECESGNGFDQAIKLLSDISRFDTLHSPDDLFCENHPYTILHAERPYDPIEFKSKKNRNFGVEWGINPIHEEVGSGSDIIEPSNDLVEIIRLDEIFSFFNNPIAYWSESRLKARKVRRPSRSIFGSVALNQRTRRVRRSEIFSQLPTTPQASASLLRWLKCYGLVSDDCYGEQIFEIEVRRAREFYQELSSWQYQPIGQFLALQLEKYKLVYWESQLQQRQGILALCWDKWTPAFQFEVWLRHLLYAANNGQYSSYLFDWFGEKFSFHPLSADQAKTYLVQYLHYFDLHGRMGVSPGPFFLDSSFAWLSDRSRCSLRKSTQASKLAYMETWHGITHYKRGECFKKPGFARYLETPDRQWAWLALETDRLLQPLFRHRSPI